MDEYYYSPHMKELAQATVKRLLAAGSARVKDTARAGISLSPRVLFAIAATDEIRDIGVRICQDKREKRFIITLPSMTACADTAADLAKSLETLLCVPVEINFNTRVQS